MSRILFACEGGQLVLPKDGMALLSREDGGNLIVLPPREVWDRSALTPVELTLWDFLIASAAKAMLEVLPQLEGGCINYWDAGNWALNPEAEPKGPKTGKEYRKVHLHLLGRSRTTTNPMCRWGESPKFPEFADRNSWSAKHQPLNAEECTKVVDSLSKTLTAYYGLNSNQIDPWSVCRKCEYPAPEATLKTHLCPTCAPPPFI